MAVTATPIFAQLVKITPITIVNADASGSKTVFTAGTNGSRVTGLTATSNDTSNRLIQVSLTRSATAYLLATFSVTTLAGTDGTTAATNLMGSTLWPGLPLDENGNAYLNLESGDTLTVASTTTVTAAKTVTVTCNAVNY